MDIKAAYERLGLGEETTQEELDRGFDLLLKREKAAASSGNHETASSLGTDIEAYRTIFDYRAKQKLRQVEEERLKKWGKLSGTVGRSEDFFRINRGRIIAVIAAIAILIGVGSVVWNTVEERRREALLPPVDLNLVFLGTYQANDMDQESELMQQALLKAFPDWKRVKIRVLYLPSPDSNGGGGMDAANMQKAMAELVASYPDILVLDKNSLDWISGQDSLADLKDPKLAQIYEAAVKKGTLVNAVNKQTGAEHAYGIDFTNTAFGKSLPMAHDGLIAGANPGKIDNPKVIEFLEKCAEIK